MSDAEFKLKMVTLLLEQTEKIGNLHTTVEVNNQKTETALSQINEKVDELKEDVSDVKDDVSNVKNQIEDLSKRLAVLENKKSVFSGIKEFISNGFGFFQKYYKFVLAAIIIFVVLFGSSLGLDVGATVTTLISLIGL